MSRIKYWDEETEKWEYADSSNESSSSDGKSAYEYARDAGYAGSEEEFAEKLAEETPKAFYVNVTDNGDGSGTMDKTYDELMAANVSGCPIIAMLNASDGASIHGGTLLTVDKGLIIGTVISQIDMKSIVIVVISSDIVTMQVMQFVPNTLPNPNALVINDKEYDGSEAVSIDTTVYEFNVTMNEDGINVSDKTYNDILAAHESGRTVICNLITDELPIRLPLVTELDGVIYFSTPLDPTRFSWCILTPEGVAEAETVDSHISIKGIIWDGEHSMDFTDTINEMIDTKVPSNISALNNDSGYVTESDVKALINTALGVIEDGSY